MNLTLTDLDRVLLRQLRAAGVLQDVRLEEVKNGKRISTLDPRGLILVPCSDGHQIIDILQHLHGLYAGCGNGNSCLHILSSNGGALNLTPNVKSATPGSNFHNHLIAQIREAIQLKKINTIALLVHAPCGKAISADMDAIDLLDGLFAARDQVLRRIKELQVSVACFIHVAWAPGNRRTYFVRHSSYANWKSRNPKTELMRL